MWVGPVSDDIPDEDDGGLACDCCCKPKRGWRGKLPVALDGNTWPVEFAAGMLGCSEKDLRDMLRVLEVEPVGTLKMSSFKRSGRHPRAYDASKLVEMWADVEELREKYSG